MLFHTLAQHTIQEQKEIEHNASAKAHDGYVIALEALAHSRPNRPVQAFSLC